MIIDLIASILSFLITVTIVLWVPSLVLKALPKDPKYNNLIKTLEIVNKKIRNIWSYTYFVLMLLAYSFISAFIGISSKPLIYKLNSPLGEGYALWASYAISGLMFYMLSRNLTLEKPKKEPFHETNQND